ncbi:hypothetical protein [Paenisporosarcina indica]|uniref:hypothetical protein n=1 Tax=Paenisporosarcina indica TaxID=650093 RepID=UPI00094F53BE|nr:hypothetical protein [Paenisporosarcina indica]
MKIRWFIYIITGFIFGVFDFLFHSFISNVLGQGGVSWRMLTYGVWLVPLIPVAIFEIRISKSKLRAALACSLTWILSIISYYLYMAFQLAFIGVSTRPELHISSQGDPFFWGNWESVFWGVVVGNIVEWSGVAVVGGFIIGFLISFIYLHLEKFIKLRSMRNEKF